MDNNTEDTPRDVTVHEEPEPLKRQQLKARGRTNSPLLKGVLVYDWDQKTVKVHSEKDIRGS